jgi:hypothetical protein
MLYNVSRKERAAHAERERAKQERQRVLELQHKVEHTTALAAGTVLIIQLSLCATEDRIYGTQTIVSALHFHWTIDIISTQSSSFLSGPVEELTCYSWHNTKNIGYEYCEWYMSRQR